MPHPTEAPHEGGGDIWSPPWAGPPPHPRVPSGSHVGHVRFPRTFSRKTTFGAVLQARFLGSFQATFGLLGQRQVSHKCGGFWKTNRLTVCVCGGLYVWNTERSWAHSRYLTWLWMACRRGVGRGGGLTGQSNEVVRIGWNLLDGLEGKGGGRDSQNDTTAILCTWANKYQLQGPFWV